MRKKKRTKQRNPTVVADSRSLIVVVVAYGSDDQLAACLGTLGRGFTVVVVDNGCSEAARRICLDAGATYVRPASNIGFAAAVNLALNEYGNLGSDVLLLNPDARVLPSDLTILCDELHCSQDLAAIGPRLEGLDGSTQKSLWPIPSPWIALASLIGAADFVARRWFVSGAVLLLRGDAVEVVGLLDERFFLYAEETDWQLRALRAGWRVGVIPNALAQHEGGGTSSEAGRRELLFNASAERFVRKWYGAFGWQVYRVASILTALRRLATSRDEQARETQRRTIGHFWRGPIRCAETIQP